MLQIFLRVNEQLLQYWYMYNIFCLDSLNLLWNFFPCSSCNLLFYPPKNIAQLFYICSACSYIRVLFLGNCSFLWQAADKVNIRNRDIENTAFSLNMMAYQSVEVNLLLKGKCMYLIAIPQSQLDRCIWQSIHCF